MEWNIGYIAKKRADLTPDKAAFIYEDKPFTYRTLNNNVNRVAHWLQQKGLKRGDRISVLLLNCPEFFDIYFAAAKLGLIFVPHNYRLVGPELKYQIDDCGSRLLIFHDYLFDNIKQVRSELMLKKNNFYYLKSGNSDCPDCPDWAVDYHETVDALSTDEPDLKEAVQIDDSLSIIYTSGVTGKPKGAVLSHQQTFFKNFQVAFYLDMTSDDVFLSQLPLFHSGGLFIVSTPTLCSGATLIMRQKFDAEQFATDLDRYKATIVFALTTMWRFILETGKLDKINMDNLKSVLGGGERTPASLYKKFESLGIKMQTGFGQTENSFMMLVPKENVMQKIGSIGKPGFFTDIWIADEDGNKLPPGKTGEIVARGPTVMSGYWNMPERTEETIVNGVLHTGDLGYKDEEGFFYIVDRAKDMYRSGGENVYPAEVEKVLYEHPKIQNVAIIGIADDKWGETGKAFIEVNQGENLTIEELNEFLKGKVAKFKFPTQIELIDALPLTGSGKIKKSDLKKKCSNLKFF